MKKTLIMLLACTAMFATSAAASTLISFTGFPGPVNTQLESFTYGGLTFTDAYDSNYMDVNNFNPNDANNALVFGTYYSDGVEITAANDAPFTLDSVDMTLSWYDGNNTDDVDVYACFGGNCPIYPNLTLTLGQRLQEYNLNFVNTSSVYITGVYSGDGYWAMDNLTIGNVSTPEPGTLALLCCGLAGLAGLRRNLAV